MGFADVVGHDRVKAIVSAALRHGRLESDYTIAELGDGDLHQLVARGLSAADEPRLRVSAADVAIQAPLTRPGPTRVAGGRLPPRPAVVGSRRVVRSMR